MKFNYDVEMGETDIKIAIARYIKEMFGVDCEVKDIKLSHEEDLSWDRNHSHTINTYKATIAKSMRT